MGIGKKIKKNINLEPQLFGPYRKQELYDKINEGGTYLPKSVLHEDLDKGFLDFVKNEIPVVVDGKKVPVVDILITTQNWAQFTQTWNFNDLDKNVTPPIITTVRTPEVKYGTLPSLQYTIPNRRQLFYAMVPTWNDGIKSFDVYTIPQPVPVDIKYSVKIVCNRMRELNAFSKVVIEKFSSRQSYTVVKGHYIPIIMDEIQDESVNELEKRKFYMQSYNFTLMGFLIDENEFEVKPAVARSINLYESQNVPRPNRVVTNVTPNIKNVNFNIDFLPSQSSSTKVFEYNQNISLETTENISSYEIYVNGFFYGQNILNSPSSSLQVSTNDSVEFRILQTDINLNSVIIFKSFLV